jgi:hypothetical protein
MTECCVLFDSMTEEVNVVDGSTLKYLLHLKPKEQESPNKKESTSLGDPEDSLNESSIGKA